MTDHFEKAFKEHHRQIVGYFFKRGFGEESRDLAQMTFMKAFSHHARFRGDCSWSLWLLKIAKNLLQNHIRDQGAQKRKAVLVSIDENRDEEQEHTSFSASSGVGHDPLTEMLTDEKLEQLRHLMNRLPPKQKTVSLMHHFQQRDVDEIATILNMNRNTVKSNLSQAKKKLQEMWENEPFPR